MSRFSGSSSIRRQQQQQQQNDFFPILSIKEITVCLQSCNINISEENLVRPNSNFTQHLFYELIVNEFLSSNINKKLEKIKQESEETSDEFSGSLNVILLQNELFKFIKVCGINDFNFMDIYKPDSLRLNRILSGIVNFARFKYERFNDYKDLINISEAQLIKRNEIIDKNINLQKKIDFMKKETSDNDNNSNNKINEINEYQNKIQKDLKNLKIVQDKLSKEHLNYKTLKNELIEKIQLKNEDIINNSKNLEDLKSLISQIDLNNLNVVKDEISLKRVEINDLKLKISSNEDQIKKFETNVNSIQLVLNDIDTLTQLLNNIKNDLKSYNEQKLKLVKYLDLKDFKTSELVTLNKKIQQFEIQINNINDKIKRFQVQRNEKAANNNTKLQDLQNQYNQLMNEKNMNDKLLMEKNSKIQSLDTEINSLTESYQNELNDTNLQIKILFNHIDNYMTRVSNELGYLQEQSETFKNI